MNSRNDTQSFSITKDRRQVNNACSFLREVNIICILRPAKAYIPVYCEVVSFKQTVFEMPGVKCLSAELHANKNARRMKVGRIFAARAGYVTNQNCTKQENEILHREIKAKWITSGKLIHFSSTQLSISV